MRKIKISLEMHYWIQGKLSPLMKDCVVQYLVNTENYALAVVTSLQVTIGLISNAVVIAAISLGQRHNKTPADVMVLNLSCSDLLPCLTFLPWMTFQLIHGIHGEPTYYFIEALFSFSVICSENAVLAVTFDRYIAICYPLRYKSIMSANQNILLTLCIWGIGFIFGVALLVSRYLDFADPLILAYGFFTIIKIGIILTMYGIIFHHLRRQTYTLSCLLNANKLNHRRKEHRKISVLVKSARKTFAIALLYLVTFLPISISFITLFLKHNGTEFSEVEKKWFKRVSCFTFLNTCIDPFIYSFRNVRFRQMFLRMKRFLIVQAWMSRRELLIYCQNKNKISSK